MRDKKAANKNRTNKSVAGKDMEAGQSRPGQSRAAQPTNKRSLGSEKELLAAEFLEEQGYHIRERNFRCRQGEIDIVARDGRELVFVEVKYRADGRQGEPEEAVTESKQRTIRRVALFYLHRYRFPENTPCRFDVVGIKGEEIRVTKNAF